MLYFKALMLRLIEIYESIQGETSLAGLPAVFIRLAGCNLRCVWCDTPYSFGRGDPFELDAIIEKVQSYGAEQVCVTGGEPLLQKGVHSLMRTLCDLGKTVSLETGGSLSCEPVDPRVRIILDIKCPGSGMSEKNLYENLSRLREHDEVKFVILDEPDYLFSKKICTSYGLFSRRMPPLFSPVHGVLDSKILIAWMLRDKLAARLNLQQHKFIWDPEAIGV